MLYHAEEYIAFWVMVVLFERCEMREIYMKDLPGVHMHGKIIEALIGKRMPGISRKMVIWQGF